MSPSIERWICVSYVPAAPLPYWLFERYHAPIRGESRVIIGHFAVVELCRDGS